MTGEMEEMLLQRPKTAGPNRVIIERPMSAFTLRPKSVLCGQDARSVSPSGRPKSGKSLNFQFGDGRITPTLSLATQGYRPLSRRVSRTRLPETIISRDGLTSALSRSTHVSSIREGARSPTPNALKNMEPAFLDVQLYRTGLTVWRVQALKLTVVEEQEIGFFHEGNAYLILRINSVNDRSLHYWLGNQCSEIDSKLVEEKAHELDKIISNAHAFSREVQNSESSVFLRLFPDGIVYVEGKHKTSVSRASTYEKRMYVLTGRKYPRASCVIPKQEHLKPENILILDGFPRMYVWLGQNSGYVQRNKAIKLARRIQHMQRKSRCHVVVIDENDVHLNDTFKRKFDGPAFPSPAKTEEINSGDETELSTDKDTEVHLVLHRVSGDRVLYDMPEADKRPLHHCYLVTNDSYLLDRGPNKTMYMWIGACAMEDEVNRSISRAKAFAIQNGYPDNIPLCRIREHHEPTEFKKCFCDWRDRLSKEMSLTKRYSVGNIGRALFSQTDRRTVATVKECWSEDTVGEYIGTTQVWVMNEGKLENWDHNGLFTNNKCYIILYTTSDANQPQQVLYYWIGNKSASEDTEKIVQLSLEKDDELNNKTVLVRVLDGKEPQHFMMAMHNWMLVYDKDENAREKKDLQMFCVRELCDSSIRIQQVAPVWPNLNSSASFVVLTSSMSYLWYGKLSGSTERESAKDLLGVLCSSKMFSYEIITDGKEPSALCKLLGDRQEYAVEYKEKVLVRRPPCLIQCQEADKWFNDIDDFAQEDISEDDIMILDLYDQVFVWCGERINKRRRKCLFETVKSYTRFDSAGRCFDDIAIWFVSQKSEPMPFTKHFQTWTGLGYSGRRSYEVLRKRIRQENAKIDVNESMIDTGFLNQPKYGYKALLKRELPNDVDDTNKHYHLTEKQFRENLKLSRQEFYRLPSWKQRQILKSARLLYTPVSPVVSVDIISHEI